MPGRKESFVKARDMYLKPGGLMMPSQGVIMACPFTDQTLWDEQVRVDPASSIYICVPEISLTTKYLHHHHHHHHQIESQYAVFFL